MLGVCWSAAEAVAEGSGEKNFSLGVRLAELLSDQAILQEREREHVCVHEREREI